MASLKFIAINDPHFSAQNPGAWKIDYKTELTNTLKQVFAYGEKVDVDAYLWAGDIFNLKSPYNNPHWLVADVAELLRSTGRPNWGIAGNHDLKYGSLKGLEGQPLEVLINTGVYELLDNKPMFLYEEEFAVQVSGISYNHGLADDFLTLKRQPVQQRVGKPCYHIALGHFWFGGQTGELFGEKIYGPDFFEKADVDCFIVGHHHDNQGAVSVGGKWFCSHGSITRVGAHKQDLERRPAAALVEVTKDGVSVRVLYPKVTPSDQCFDLEVRKKIVQEKKELEEFVQSLRTSQWQSSDPKTILAELVREKEVVDRATHYLQEAENAV